MVTTISYEPVVEEEILFQPSNMKVEYVKELNNAENVLEHETPLFNDVIELIMDFTVGTASDWKKKFTNGVINQLNKITSNGETPKELYNNRISSFKNDEITQYVFNPVKRIKQYAFYESKFEKIMKEKNIKTKKQIVEYYMEKHLCWGYNDKINNKEMMRMKKHHLIQEYAYRMCEIAHDSINNVTHYNRYLTSECNETQRKNAMKDFMRRNLYEYYSV